MQTYTYDPSKINESAKDQMRFELGDTVVDMGALSSPLCDEEYTAMLEKHKKWRHAKVACLRAIVMKLSFEVDTKVSDLSYSLSQRADRWREMLKEEEGKLKSTSIDGIRANQDALSPNGRTPYFYNDLHTNPRKF